MADSTHRARKMPADRIARARYVSLPAPLDARVDEAATRLRVSRTLLLREAVTRGLKAAVDNLRREQRRHSGTNSGTNGDASGDGAGK